MTPDGGAIEVFPSSELAARDAAGDPVSRAAPALAAYRSRQGPVLIGLSGRLTPEQVAAYQAGLSEIVPRASLAALPA